MTIWAELRRAWRDRAVRRLAVGAVIFNLALALVAGEAMLQLRRINEQTAARQVADTARLLEADIEQTLEKVDLALQNIVDQHLLYKPLGPQVQGEALARLAARHPALNILLTTTAAGEVMYWPPRPPGAGVSVADRSYFARLRDDPAAGLQMTPPVVGRTTGTPVMVLARRLSDAQGRFDGVAFGAIPIRFFVASFESMFRQPSDTLTVLDAQGGLIASVRGGAAELPAPAGAASAALPSHAPPSSQAKFVRSKLRNAQYGYTLELAISPEEHVGTTHLEMFTILSCWLAFGVGSLIWATRALMERRRQEDDVRALRASEGRTAGALAVTQHFIDHFPGAAFLKDENLRVLLANRGFKDLLGLEPAALIGKSNEEIFPGEFGVKLSRDDRRVLESTHNEIIEEAFGNGYYETHKFRVPGSDGRMLLGGLTVDVTLRHQVAERVRAMLELNVLGSQLGERDFVSRALEAAEQLTSSHIGFLHYINEDQESIELVTWTQGALNGCRAAFDQHYPISQAGVWADAFRSRSAVVFNDYPGYAAKHGLPDGHAPLLRLVCVPVIEGDKVRMLMGVGNRETDYDDFAVATLQLLGNDIWRNVGRLRAEAALKQRVNELDALNSRLTSAQSQLLHSEKMASIGQLAAGVAHELNTPIGFVHSNLGTLAEYVADLLHLLDLSRGCARQHLTAGQLQPLEQAWRERDIDYVRNDIVQLLAESRDGANRVRVIVKNLRDLAHVSDDELVWSDLREGLDSTLKIVWNELKYKVDVVKEYADIPTMLCMPAQLNQVFMNLLLNAGQAIATRGRITIRTGASASEVWVEVEDNGQGIAAEHISRIFEPFFTTKPVGHGTGLGLSVSHSIVAKHRGRIAVRSEPGAGSCFRVSLPLMAAEATAGAALVDAVPH